jgi:DNA-binding NarL/FixJ family response regulator
VRRDGVAASARRTLDEPAVATAWAAGHALSLDRAVAEAMIEVEAAAGTPSSARGEPTSRPEPGATPRSARELAVLGLIADGRVDREIAAALAISPRTVTTHVAAILDKLGVPTRAAAAATAVRRGLI